MLEENHFVLLSLSLTIKSKILLKGDIGCGGRI